MDIYQARKIHCLGIGGIGVSALAKLFEAQEKEISGYDDASPLRGGAPPLSGEIDLVVYSDAIPEDHPQRVMARQWNILQMSYAQVLGQISRDYKTIVVAGTHGKSTTTAMLGLILEAAGFDPLVIVGAKVPKWNNSNIRLPNSKFLIPNSRFLVVEGDDYRDHFLELNPYAVVITNIEYDHPDYFRDLAHTVESFRNLVGKVHKDGLVVVNEDDRGCQQLITQLQHTNILENVGMLQYGRASELFGKLSLQAPGEFNKYNALAAATCARELGISDGIIKKSLGEFRGVWRRFEIVGQLHDSRFMIHDSPIIISDYGHHPTAIRVTMRAAREAYPDRRLVLVYQPHQHSRTRHLFNDFVDALKDAADIVIVSDIYAVKGRLEDRDISSRDLVDEISRLRNSEIKSVFYGGDLARTEKIARDTIQDGDVVIFMGAGDIDTIARRICEKIK